MLAGEGVLWNHMQKVDATFGCFVIELDIETSLCYISGCRMAFITVSGPVTVMSAALVVSLAGSPGNHGLFHFLVVILPISDFSLPNLAAFLCNILTFSHVMRHLCS